MYRFISLLILFFIGNNLLAAQLSFEFDHNNCQESGGAYLRCNAIPNENLKLVTNLDNFKSGRTPSLKLIENASLAIFFEYQCSSFRPLDIEFHVKTNSNTSVFPIFSNKSNQMITIREVADSLLSIELVYRPQQINYINKGCRIKLHDSIRYLEKFDLLTYINEKESDLNFIGMIADAIYFTVPVNPDLTTVKDFFKSELVVAVENCLSEAQSAGGNSYEEDRSTCFQVQNTASIRRLRTRINKLENLLEQLNHAPQTGTDFSIKDLLARQESDIYEDLQILSLFLSNEIERLGSKSYFAKELMSYEEIFENLKRIL